MLKCVFRLFFEFLKTDTHNIESILLAYEALKTEMLSIRAVYLVNSVSKDKKVTIDIVMECALHFNFWNFDGLHTRYATFQYSIVSL